MGLLTMPILQCAGSGPRLTLVRLMHACDSWFPDTFSLHTITTEQHVSACMNTDFPPLLYVSC